MNSGSKYQLATATVFLWIGFVGAISFMEAWLKFRAPGITLSLGLGIGRLVFGALNKVEWVFAIAVLINLIRVKEIKVERSTLYFIPLALLVMQTFWILPILDTRAELIIRGQEVPASNYHIAYLVMEIIKVVCLMIFGVRLLRITTLG